MSTRSKRFIQTPSKTISGILLMLLHALSMSLLYVFSKKLTQSLHPFQVAFMYKFAILLAILPWCFWGNYKKNLSTKKPGMHVARGTFSLLGTLCFFVAVSKLGVLDASAISYLDHLVVMLIGFLYFKEKITNAKIIMIILCTTGAMLIIKPGFVKFNVYYVYLFLALIFWALNCTVIKILGTTERSKAQIFYVMLFSSLFSLPLAMYEWHPVEAWHFKYILLIALCYLVHTIAFFKAFKFADLSTVMPFDYSRLLFTGLLGVLILHEVPDKYSVIGYGFIFLSGLYAIFDEANRQRKERKLSKARAMQIESEYEQI